MGKIIKEYETEYEVGDIVIFRVGTCLLVGIIEGYYVDHMAGESLWFNIRTSPDFVYTYSNHGDISEWDIIGKIDGKLLETCKELITKGIDNDVE